MKPKGVMIRSARFSYANTPSTHDRLLIELPEGIFVIDLNRRKGLKISANSLLLEALLGPAKPQEASALLQEVPLLHRFLCAQLGERSLFWPVPTGKLLLVRMKAKEFGLPPQGGPYLRAFPGGSTPYLHKVRGGHLLKEGEGRFGRQFDTCIDLLKSGRDPLSAPRVRLMNQGGSLVCETLDTPSSNTP